MADCTFDGDLSLDLELDGDLSLELDLDGELNMVDVVHVNEVSDHRLLTHRDAPDQHPIEAITNLAEILDSKADDIPIDALTNMEIQDILDHFV